MPVIDNPFARAFALVLAASVLTACLGASQSGRENPKAAYYRELVAESAGFDADVAECMRKRGYEMQPEQAIALGPTAEYFGYQSLVGDGDAFATDGYGITETVIATQVSQLSDAQLDPEYVRALRGDSQENQGCTGEALAAHPILERDFERSVKRSEFFDALQVDFATGGVTDRWRDCMAQHGLAVTTPVDLVSGVEQEVSTVFADVTLERLLALNWRDGRAAVVGDPDLQDRIDRAEALELRFSKVDAECGVDMRAQATARLSDFEAEEFKQ